MSQGVIELVVFKARGDTAPSQVSAAAAAITPILRAMPGFVGREFAIADDGRFADIVRWVDMASAKAAAEKVMQIPECGAFFSLIDQESMTFLHLDVQERV